MLTAMYMKTAPTPDLKLQLNNTIQVREAIKGTKMNVIILLFTIATILYLPTTFVTVIGCSSPSYKNRRALTQENRHSWHWICFRLLTGPSSGALLVQ